MVKVKLYTPESRQPPPITLRLVEGGDEIILVRVDDNGIPTIFGNLISVNCTTGRFSRKECAVVPGLDFDSKGRIIIHDY